MKVIIAGGGTGGHLFPAVAVGEELLRQHPAVELLFVGTSAGFEARWLPGSGYRYELLKVHGIRGHDMWQRARAMGAFAGAAREALRILRRFGADLVVSAGGYASVPMALAAILTCTPLLLMEQNTRPGLANRMLWRFARRVCVGFDETAAFFNRAKVEVTGNPVRGMFEKRVSAPRSKAPNPQILVLGGSSGAHRLNIGVLKAFKNLAKDVIKFDVVHQTGEADVGLVMAGYRDLGWARTQVLPFIDDVAAALAACDLLVARAGALTVSEVALAGRAAIFVPYPFHRDRQQELNARVLERCGGAIVIRDDEQLADNLARAITQLIGDHAQLERMGRDAHSAAKPGAAARIARRCFELASEGVAA